MRILDGISNVSKFNCLPAIPLVGIEFLFRETRLVFFQGDAHRFLEVSNGMGIALDVLGTLGNPQSTNNQLICFEVVKDQIQDEVLGLGNVSIGVGSTSTGLPGVFQVVGGEVGRDQFPKESIWIHFDSVLGDGVFVARVESQMFCDGLSVTVPHLHEAMSNPLESDIDGLLPEMEGAIETD